MMVHFYQGRTEQLTTSNDKPREGRWMTEPWDSTVKFVLSGPTLQIAACDHHEPTELWYSYVNTRSSYGAKQNSPGPLRLWSICDEIGVGTARLPWNALRALGRTWRISCVVFSWLRFWPCSRERGFPLWFCQARGLSEMTEFLFHLYRWRNWALVRPISWKQPHKKEF